MNALRPVAKSCVCRTAMLAATICLVVTTRGQNRAASTVMELRGQAAGGTLTFMHAPQWSDAFISITNAPGDSARTVLARLALQYVHMPDYLGEKRGVLSLSDARMEISGSNPYVLGGTETGFGIPRAPISLSLAFDSDRNAILARWECPESPCDVLHLLYNGVPLVRLRGTDIAFTHVRENSYFERNVTDTPRDVTVFVVGTRGGTPSNGVGVRLRHGRNQESLMNVPFTCGIAPGFCPWSQTGTVGRCDFAEGRLPGMESCANVDRFQGRGFYQVLKGSGTFSGGVSRRFLGLAPGHRYRVGARMNTLATKGGGWAFSLHASPNPAGGGALTADQMAGLSPLPGGRQGADAGLVTRLDASSATGGKWLELRSSDKRGDFVLPPDTSVATLWFRLEGQDANACEAGLDTVTLEDMGPDRDGERS